ncbi:MAG: hypothetical protein AB9869_38345, partial [Verrucomicrobiia bacterium]
KASPTLLQFPPKHTENRLFIEDNRGQRSWPARTDFAPKRTKPQKSCQQLSAKPGRFARMPTMKYGEGVNLTEQLADATTAWDDFLGYYDKQGNVTRDRNSNRLCQGDALSSLILKAAGS